MTNLTSLLNHGVTVKSAPPIQYHCWWFWWWWWWWW